MQRKYIITGAILGAIAVVLGALASHGLKPILSVKSMDAFNTGVRYQMYHAILLLVTGSLAGQSFKYMKTVYYLIVLGVLFFSGSIYGLTVGPLVGIQAKFLGPITPIGGILLITAWITIAISALKRN